MFNNLLQIKNWLNQKMQDNLDNSDQAIYSTLNPLGDREVARQFLSILLQSKERLEAIASSSYVHDNGFDKFVLISSDKPAYKLRLHIWWPLPQGEMPPVENIHNHRWNFSSAVLTGAFIFEEYERSSQGLPVTEYKYYSPDGKSHYNMEIIGKTALNSINRGTRIKGDQYSLSHEILHRVVSKPECLTVTLVLQGAPAKNYTNVFATQPLKHTEEIQLKKFSIDDIRRKFIHVQSVL